MEDIQAQAANLDKLADTLMDLTVDVGGKLLLALLIYIAGRLLIKWIMKLFDKTESVSRIDGTARNYMRNCLRVVLYVLLAVSIIAELGVPMSSIVAVIASCGVAVGLGLQGALTNIAGGLMLLIFRPFKVGDYISSGGNEGSVKDISLIYTRIRTFDNRVVSLPNGNLMNSAIINTTCEEMRRVDISFNISGDEPVNKVKAAMMKVIINIDSALAKPDPEVIPVEAVPGGLKYAVRVWVNTPDYWTVYGELMTQIPAALNKADIQMAATPVKMR